VADQVSPAAGLFAFFYATLHLLTYVALYAGFDVNTMIADITKRRFITVGVAAWLLLLPLALTSTNWRFASWRQKLEPAAQACLPGGDLRRCALLVAGEVGRVDADPFHDRAGHPAPGAACAKLAAAAQGAGCLRVVLTQTAASFGRQGCSSYDAAEWAEAQEAAMCSCEQ